MKKVSFVTLGCRVNQYESVALAEALTDLGYETVQLCEDTELCIVNTCAVTSESAKKSAKTVRKAARLGAEVAVLGCASQLNEKLFRSIPGVIYVGGNGNKHGLVDFLKRRDAEKLCEVTDVPEYFEPLSIGKHTTSLFSTCRAYIKIQDGCNCSCSYCTIPLARGRSRSRDINEIICEAQRLASLGYSEIELTGIEVGAYTGAPLGELIRRVAAIDGIRRVRLGSLSPNCITQGFISAVKSTPEFMPHLHISVQSGSGEVLKLMRRPYSGEKLYEKLDIIKKELPEAQISVDIICGFPGETEADFQQTLSLVEKYRFSHVHAFPYSERDGTLAVTLPGSVPMEERRSRNERLLALSRRIHAEILDEHIGTSATVLVEKIDNGVCNGHTADYLEVDVAYSDGDKTGDYIEVNIISDDGDKMYGERIEK